MKTDLAIIGGGGAGFGAAAKANELGVNAVLINRGLPMGGTCVNVGCVPSKFLLEVGFDRYRAAHPRFRAIQATHPEMSFEEVVREKEAVVAKNRDGKYRDVLKGYKNIHFIDERARFLGPGKLQVGKEIIEAKYVVICTGSSNKSINIPGMETIPAEDIWDNIKAFSLKTLPKSMIVMGGGPTGLEVAQVFSHFGTRITQVEAKDRVFAVTEPEISEVISQNLRSEGIELLTSTKAKKIQKVGGEIVLTVETHGAEKELQAEKLFLAIGVKGNTEDLNLAAIGLQSDKNGFIDVDDQMRTKIPNVFAAGDVAGPPWLETLAAREGAIAVESALNGGKMRINYDAVPAAVFIEPQVAVVGLTEEESMNRLGKCDCRTVELKLVPKADITNQTQGIAKMAINPDSQKIVGFHLVAPHAAEIIHEATLAIQSGMTVDDLINTVHVFPSFSEVVKLTAQAFRRDVSHMSCCVE